MGLFDRQKLFQGEKLTEAYSENEHFILYDIAVVVEDSTELVEGSTVDKVELITQGGKDGDTPILTSSLSGPIVRLGYQNVRDKKGKPVADDLPAICRWKKVDTRNNFDNQATVLDFVEPYTGKVPATLPAFSFTPITQDDNPLVEA